MVLRGAILAHAPDAQKLLGGEVEIDESYFGGKRKGKRGRGAAGKVTVFGLLDRDGLHLLCFGDHASWKDLQSLCIVVIHYSKEASRSFQ
jgi:transposase